MLSDDRQLKPSGRDGPHVRRAWRTPAKRMAQLVLAGAVIFFIALALHRSWSSIQGHDWTFQPLWLALSALAFLAFYAAQAVAWWLLLRGFRLSSSLLLASATWAKSILGRYLPGTVFMFVGRAWMCHNQGLSVARVSAAMVYEQALGVCSAIVALVLVSPFWMYSIRTTLLSLCALPLLLALLHPRVFGPVSSWLLARLRRPPLGAVLPFRAVVGLLAFYTCAWTFSGVGAWALARAVAGVDVDTVALVTAAYALAYVAGMIAFLIPSGIGVREAVLTVALTASLGSGVALAWALMLRLWVTLVELAFVGLVSALEYGLRRRGAA